MIGFQCPSCQRKLSVQDEHAGKKIKCPGCGTISAAPPPAPPAPPPMAVILTSPPGATDTRPTDQTRDFGSGPGEPQPDSALIDFLAPPQADDELGRLGKYRILGIIGRGGMGVVYKAEDPVLKRIVAIKAILPSLGAGDHIRKRFLREARTMAQLEHDHIVRLYEVNEDRGVPYIAMEFLVGEPLDRRLKSEGVMPIAETLRIGREIASGLAAAHARSLIHRDIKPANVFLTGNRGRVKILDFGLARADQEESRITQSGAVMGTPAYMAPEQGRGEKVDFRCDLFSLGVVLYRLSTGTEPFTAEDALSTMMAIATETPISPQMTNFDVPTELSDLIMMLLEKDPAKRSSAQAVVDELSRIERGEPTAPKPAAEKPEKRPSAAKVKPKPKGGQFPWLIVLGVAAVLVACIAAPFAVAAFFLLR
jgi:serine/threonine protein kinase